MTHPTCLLKPLALAALLTAATASQAAFTVVTSLAAFSANTSVPGTDTFAGLSIIVQTNSPITRSAGPYSYTATSSIGRFFGGGTTGNPFLSTELAETTITFSNFNAAVRGVGGNFFAANISGLFAPGDVTLTATDSSGTITRTIIGATTSGFLGFVSDGPISSLTLAAVQPLDGFVWPAADNLVMAIPEPGTYALMLFGLGALGVAARRRS